MSLEKIINDAWEKKDQVNQNSDQKLKDTINQECCLGFIINIITTIIKNK